MAPPVASVAKPTVTIFGTNGGKFFGFVPDFVDLKKAPGASVQPAATFSEVRSTPGARVAGGQAVCGLLLRQVVARTLRSRRLTLWCATALMCHR